MTKLYTVKKRQPRTAPPLGIGVRVVITQPIYPREVWPETTADEMAALHEFARSRGMADGSRYHVGGIRHALALLRPEPIRTSSTGSESSDWALLRRRPRDAVSRRLP